MKILISDQVEGVCSGVLKEEGFEVDFRPGIKNEELKEIVGGYEGLIVRSSTQVTAEIIASAGKMRVIGRAGAGVDNIDCEAATRRGIIVMNTPGGNTISTAEHTVSLLLSLARNIPQACDSIRRGKWERKLFTGMELFGKTLGIVGLGKIGREVSLRCQAFGMKTIGYDPVLSEDVAAKLNIELVSLGDLFSTADIITVHTPLNDETRGLISDDQINACKPGVRIINCARGGIVDEGALLRGLQSGKVGGAALDVFEHEPPSVDELLQHPKLIATPHLGASTEEAQEKVAKQIALQVADLLHERGISGAVNAEVIQMAMRHDLKPYVRLAEKLGSLEAQLVAGKLRRITVTTVGHPLVQSSDLIASAVLKGVLSQRLSEPVNLVNASMIARELGISIEERRETDGGSYTHLLEVEYESDEGKKIAAGTVFENSHLRIVRMDGYRLEVVPEGTLIFYKNIDKPGMLAAVGSILASAGINIAGLALGRDEPGKRALTIINVDSPIPHSVLKKMEMVEGVFEVRSAKL